MLELTNVALRYGKHLALHGVGISIAAAETVVVLG
ncbi:MAG: ABC transporter ATP-binding protein, partial [Alphaproteobacteria bacterium]